MKSTLPPLDLKTKNLLSSLFTKSQTDLSRACVRAFTNTKSHRNPHKRGAGGVKVYLEKYEVSITPIDIASRYLEQGGKCFYTGMPIDLRATFETLGDAYPPYGLSMNRYNPDFDFTPDNSVASIQSVYNIKRDTQGDVFKKQDILHLLPPLRETYNHSHFMYQLNSFIRTMESFDHLTQVNNYISALRNLRTHNVTKELALA